MEDVYAYDTTLFERDGTWWMFTNIKAIDGASSWDELYLFYSDDPINGSWQPHPLNPIVSDVRTARPAGRIYEESGRLIRPSQNSSYRYGYGLNLMEIQTLGKTEYSEKVKKQFFPDWDSSAKAVHSYTCADNLTVVDAIFRRRRTNVEARRE